MTNFTVVAMTDDRRVSPMMVKLQGGILDGDSFEILPHGSVLPPMRLSYPYRDKFLDNASGVMVECGCWLHYEAKDKVPEWSDSAIVYVYAGKEKMKKDR